jgi:hypothetical protein
VSLTSLGEKQKLFVRNVANLIEFATSRGYELSFGDAYRDPRVFGKIGESKGYGHRSSAHKNRLAIDLNLFKDGKYLTTDKDHEPLGIYWESLSPLNRWGGRFKDGNHYSIEHEGVK